MHYTMKLEFVLGPVRLAKLDQLVVVAKTLCDAGAAGKRRC